MEMYQIMIAPKDSKANIMLSYNSKDSMEGAYKNIHDRIRQEGTLLTAKDDFGYVLDMQVDNISYALIVDLENEQEVIMQSALARQKASMALYDKYRNDPAAMQLLSSMQQPRQTAQYPQNKPKLEI